LHVFANAIRDTRHAIRQLLHTPGFTLVAVLTLALGIGATSTIFSVVNGVLLRPLAYPESDRLVRVNEILQKFGRFSVAPATFLDCIDATLPAFALTPLTTVISDSVAQRRLGDVLQLVVGGGMKLALAGVAIGILGALSLARFVETMLYEVTPFDPASYAATAAVLLTVAALACYVPARRAMRVDPIVALRTE
jgi:hypothetical protein